MDGTPGWRLLSGESDIGDVIWRIGVHGVRCERLSLLCAYTWSQGVAFKAFFSLHCIFLYILFDIVEHGGLRIDGW